MRKGETYFGWIAAITYVLACGVAIYGPSETKALLCDKSSNCLATWVGALSGWVAAVGALCAALWTIGPLREQVREARRQSDFLVGDAEPEIVLIRNREEKTVKLRITNWNRHTVMIDSVSCVSPSSYQVSNVLDAEDERLESRLSRTGQRYAYRVDGWFDRSKAPERRSLVVVFSRDGQIDTTAATNRVGVSVAVSYRVVGQHHERRQVVVSALDLSPG
ncbi:hypothetical protein [Ensifer adhaerens]|uniref:Uncharacterized protein n=1 Tax=Ensifer adhaerens TaxID=106592 RepID=A0A9Q8Y978_ENSAD|nr:hypothetical protein [Ensifer adhaerens]USJ24692.1 hypothetical protein NE863_06925 [Ensifer adhaerens]